MMKRKKEKEVLEKKEEELESGETKSQSVLPQEKEWKERYLRLYAEFENTKKRLYRDRAIWHQMANKELILGLLPTLDDFERAMENFDKDGGLQEDRRQGLMLIFNNLQKCLNERGLKVMDVEVGQEPSPQEHRVLTGMNTLEEDLKGRIVKVVTKGYLLYDEVIRHAEVIIGT